MLTWYSSSVTKDQKWKKQQKTSGDIQVVKNSYQSNSYFPVIFRFLLAAFDDLVDLYLISLYKFDITNKVLDC